MVTTTSIVNRPDERKIEQGLSGGKLPFLDQTGPETVFIEPRKWGDLIKDEKAISAIGNRSKLFAGELEGWKGYVVVHCSNSRQRRTLGTTNMLSAMWNGKGVRRRRQRLTRYSLCRVSLRMQNSSLDQSLTRILYFLVLIGRCGITPLAVN